MNPLIHLCFLLIIGIYQASYIPTANLKEPPYASWAHEHWIWIHRNGQNHSNLIDLYHGYTSRNIPVGAVNIDSRWSTGVNNFLWDYSKFPDPKKLITYFHDRNVKVICWVTSMINTDSSNYEEALKKNYFLNNGSMTIKWWHGRGTHIDYDHPEALEWWHKQMDQILDLGIDGWKCDGTDPYVWLYIIPRGYKGFVHPNRYAEMYYRDFFYYTRQRRGKHALIMARPYDSVFGIIQHAFAPRDVVFSGWVGDQESTFTGLKHALHNMFFSAWKNYVGFGSDIGGYIDKNRTKELFIRWAQLGAFNTLMENGGGGEHRPWKFDEETVDIYRRFVVIHHELIPYMHTAGSIAYETNISVMKPVMPFSREIPKIWDYFFWKDIFVSPITEEGLVTKMIQLPSGNDWVDWWNGTLYRGGMNISYPLSLHTFPVFKRAGSIIPMNISHRYSLHGDESFAGHLTLWIEYPSGTERIEVREDNGGGRIVEYKVHEKGITFISTVHKDPLIIIIRGYKNHIKQIMMKTNVGVKILERNIDAIQHEGWRVHTDGKLEIRVESVNGVHLEIMK